MTDSATLQQTAHITGRQMDHWRRRGWLVAGDRQGAGSGCPIDWPARAVNKAVLMARLIRIGFTPLRAHALSEAYLAIHNGREAGTVTLSLASGLQLRIEPVRIKEVV